MSTFEFNPGGILPPQEEKPEFVPVFEEREPETDEFVPVFEEPPAPRVHRRQSAVFTPQVVETLETNPNKWLVVLQEAKMTATTNAQNWAKRRPGFIVTSRNLGEDAADPKKPYRVYAKFDPSIVERETAELKERRAAEKIKKQKKAEKKKADKS